ncbi:MAG: nuclear transport factor 2 family protein [Hyphomicrobiales bacterium]|nr:nuclear transport factor 2 family protein [Hyphomicrobiales bacterium]
MTNNEQSAKEVREVLDNWGKALFQKDLEAMHKSYVENCRLFDVKASLKGVENAKETWKKLLPYFDKPQIEYRDLEIHATDDMAVVHFRNRITGTVEPMPEEMANVWLRGTVCYKKIDGVWKCIHEHISFPVDGQTMQVAKAA